MTIIALLILSATAAAIGLLVLGLGLCHVAAASDAHIADEVRQ